MRIRYGSYKLGVASSEIAISSDPIVNALGQTTALEVVWSIKTRLKNPTGRPKDFTAILQQFEDAFAVNGRDLSLEMTDGKPTHHQLLSRNCIGGTRVVRFPTYPTGRKGQLINYRDVEIEIRGTIPRQASQYLEFSENITIRGGGARFGIREVNIGPGVRQRLRTHTTCFATQSGSATGYLVKPFAPPAIWPAWLVDEFPDTDDANPQTIGSGGDAALTNFQTRWSWQFAAPYRLFGTPHYLTGR